MSSQYSFNKETVRRMNYNSTWRGTINTEIMDKTTKKTDYKLHATGDCTLDGRVYIALPENVDSTNWEVKKKYNLM